jgi:hypothetical protein
MTERVRRHGSAHTERPIRTARSLRFLPSRTNGEAVVGIGALESEMRWLFAYVQAEK